MKVKIFPYKLGSESARALARELDTICVKPDGNYKPYSSHLIINWGNSRQPQWATVHDRILNSYNAVRYATNKLASFERFRNLRIPTPEWTTDYRTALQWFSNGDTVVERHNLTGSQGDGIRMVGTIQSTNDMVDHNEMITQAPLYTKLVPRAREYRVHVFDGRVIDTQQKKRREGNDSDGRIKNLENGWVFTRDNITTPPDSINSIAINAVQALGLDFGAVDIVTKDDNCYVLEVNTACGLEGTTLTNYVNAIKRYANN